MEFDHAQLLPEFAWTQRQSHRQAEDHVFVRREAERLRGSGGAGDVFFEEFEKC